jgi:hypothetical protein
LEAEHSHLLDDHTKEQAEREGAVNSLQKAAVRKCQEISLLKVVASVGVKVCVRLLGSFGHWARVSAVAAVEQEAQEEIAEMAARAEAEAVMRGDDEKAKAALSKVRFDEA